MRAAVVTVLLGTSLFAGVFLKTSLAQSTSKPVAVQVYKSPTCGCCAKWVAHMRDAGFEVTATDVESMPAIRAKLGVPDAAASCHTAVVGSYIVEGHVPSADVRQLLAKRPAVAGIAAPGMPLGSPGMESETPHAYNVVSFDKQGKTAVFASHGPGAR